MRSIRKGANRRPSAFALRVVRFDQRHQPAPGHHPLHLMSLRSTLRAALRAVYLAALGSARNFSRRVVFFFRAYSSWAKLSCCSIQLARSAQASLLDFLAPVIKSASP